MSELNRVTCMSPDSRVAAIMAFLERLISNVDVQQKMQSWGLEFVREMVAIPGRVFPPEIIFQGGRQYGYNANEADWSREVRREFSPLLL